MSTAPISGPRESSAGDEFHVLWATRRALALLDPESGLESVLMEELTPTPMEGIEPEVLLGVDMTEYYGGMEFATAGRVIVSQLKYSHRNPDKSWTAGRLAALGSRGQKGVIGRLADLFAGVSATATRDEVLARLEIRLVSNRPRGIQLCKTIRAANAWLTERPGPVRTADLTNVLDASAQKDIRLLLNASGLDSYAFTDFLRVLSFDYLGVDGLAGQEMAITAAVGAHVMDDLEYESLKLVKLVRDRALPAGQGSPIGKTNVLVALGVSQEADLLPAPAHLRRPEHPVLTSDAARILAALDAAQDRRVLAHGAAGVGKSTAILALENQLPSGSVVLTYDCFGDGDYETAAGVRHTARRFGLQLCNELAARCRLPLLVTPPRDMNDLWRELDRRLTVVGTLLEDRGARLIVVVDAADNSVYGGRWFSQDTFLRGLWSQAMPPGTGLVVTCRTHRRSELDSPPNISEVELGGFDLAASAEYLRRRFPDANDSEAKDFHDRTNGNPRVQFYMLSPEQAGPDTDVATVIERAHGTPTPIFEDLYTAAVKHVASEAEAREKLAELVCLTKPLTRQRFGAVSGLTADRVREFCKSLVPGVRIEDDIVAFRDEDFATFLREKVGDAEQTEAHGRLAEYFLDRQDDEYAALVVADHLQHARRGDALIELALTGGAPPAISDALIRQQTYRRRLILALGNATSTAARPAACRLVVLAGEAARQGLAVREILRQRPDLGMRYGDPEAVMRVYAEDEKMDWQGPVHMQLAAMYARAGDEQRALVDARMAEAWIDRRAGEEREWRIDADDVAALAEAGFHVLGAEAAVWQLERWRPVAFAVEAGEALVRRLAVTVPGKDLGELIDGQDLPATICARLLAAMFAVGVAPDGELVLRVTRLLISEPPVLDAEDGSWAARFAELAAATRLGTDVVLELLGALALPRPRSAPHRFEWLARFRDPLRIMALRAACEKRDPELDELMPASVTNQATDPQSKSDADSERRAMSERVGRYVPVYAIRAQAILRGLPVGELRAARKQWLAKPPWTGYRDEVDRGHRQWLAAFADALLACEGTDVQLIRDVVDAVPRAALGQEAECWLTIARRLTNDPRYRDEGLRVLEKAAAHIELAEVPARQRVEVLLSACTIADSVDSEQAQDLHTRAITAAEGMDDDGIGRLEFHAQLAAALAGISAANELAERIGQALVAHRLRVSEESALPWSATINAIAKMHPQTALALLGRWEDQGHMLLHASVFAVVVPLVDCGFLTPTDALALLVLAGEEANPMPQATELLERINPGPERAAALENLSLRVRRDLLPDTRAQSAVSLHAWAVAHQLANTEAIHALETLLPADDEQPPHGPWAESAQKDRSKRERAADRIVARAAKGDPSTIEQDLLDLMKLSVNDRVASYLDACLEAIITSRRQAFIAALAGMPADHPAARFHARDILSILISANRRWQTPAPLRRQLAESLGQVLRTHLPALTRFIDRGEHIVRDVLALECTDEPADLVVDAIVANMERLSPAALYGLAADLATTLEPDQRAELLRWSLDELATSQSPAPELPTTRADVLAGLLWALFAAPDKATRWRAAHVARQLLLAPDTALASALFRYSTTKDGGAFSGPGIRFFWLPARVWTLMVIARVGRDRPDLIVDLAPELAKVACSKSFPHVGLREFARRAALQVETATPGTLSPETRDELRITNVPRACASKRRHTYGDGDDRRRDFDAQRFHFSLMDTLPYIFGPFGRHFGLTANDICERAEVWIIDRLGLDDDSIPDERLTRVDSSVRHSSHGDSSRVESWHEMVERQALQLVAGELCDQGAALICEPYDDAPDPWEDWLKSYLDSTEYAWLIDLRDPVPPVSELLMTDIVGSSWPRISGADLDRAVRATDPDLLVVDADVLFSARFGYGRTDVTSALVSPQNAATLCRVFATGEDPRFFRLPIEYEHWDPDDAEINQGEFRLQAWLWQDRDDGIRHLEQYDPLGRISLDVTRPGAAFIGSCAGRLEVGGRRVLVPTEQIVAQHSAWSDIAHVGDGRRETYGTRGSITTVRRDALRQFLSDARLLLIIRAIATRSISRDYRNEANDEQLTHRLYLLGPEGKLLVADEHGQLATLV